MTRPRTVLAALADLALWLAILGGVVLLCVGCVPLSPYAVDRAPRIDSEAWCKDVSWGRAAWIAEAHRRFDDPFVFVAHGASLNGTWMLYPDNPRPRRSVESKAWDLHLAMPDRDIVLIVCNAGGATLKVPRVWYARAIVRARPHDPFKPGAEVDDIWQFRCDG